MEKHAEKMHHKVVSQHYLILVNNYRYSQCTLETLLEIRYFERGFSTSALFLNLVSF